MASGLGSGIGDQEQALQEETNEENRHIRLTIDDFYEVAWLTQSSIVNCVDIALLLPKPTVAAVSGHAYAGGAILALSCDFRILAKGDFGFALNEINLGIVLPPGIIRMAISAAGPNHAREIYSSAIRSRRRALEIGLAHSLAEPEAVLETAALRCSALAPKPHTTYAAIKHSLRELTDHSATRDNKRALGDFIEQWFSEEAESRKQALLKSLVTPAKE